MPTELDIYPTKSWDRDALLQPESRAYLAMTIEPHNGRGLADIRDELHDVPRSRSGNGRFTSTPAVRCAQIVVIGRRSTERIEPIPSLPFEY